MFEIHYERSDIEDFRVFKDLEEFNEWLSAMKKLNEVYFITEIEERS